MRFSRSLSMTSRTEGAISQELASPPAALCDTEQVYVALQRMTSTSRPPCYKYVFTRVHVSCCNHRHPTIQLGRQGFC